jgi:hypothetical protein
MNIEYLSQYYKNLLNTYDSSKQMMEIMESHLGFKPNQILHANSICSDDINEIEFPKHVYKMLGPFRMGGLDGFPFAGLTGIKAYSSHVPEEGALFIYFGPHIGHSDGSELGMVKRTGQNFYSSCCGAATLALAKLQKGQIKEGEITELDYQQNVLEQILLKNADRILSSTCQIYEATEVIYEAIKERILLLLGQTTLNCRYLILAGGVVINSGGTNSFSSTRIFHCIEQQSGAQKDLLPFMKFESVSNSKLSF